MILGIKIKFLTTKTTSHVLNKNKRTKINFLSKNQSWHLFPHLFHFGYLSFNSTLSLNKQ